MRNNPLRRTDPSGHADCDIDSNCGGNGGTGLPKPPATPARKKVEMCGAACDTLGNLLGLSSNLLDLAAVPVSLGQMTIEYGATVISAFAGPEAIPAGFALGDAAQLVTLNQLENDLGIASAFASTASSFLLGTTSVDLNAGQAYIDIGVVESWVSAGLGTIAPEATVDFAMNVMQVGYDTTANSAGSPGQLQIGLAGVNVVTNDTFFRNNLVDVFMAGVNTLGTVAQNMFPRFPR